MAHEWTGGQTVTNQPQNDNISLQEHLSILDHSVHNSQNDHNVRFICQHNYTISLLPCKNMLCSVITITMVKELGEDWFNLKLQLWVILLITAQKE